MLSVHAEENGWPAVTRVTLKIGKMRQVIPDVMKFSFSVASEGTPLEGAELEIIELPLSFTCRKCGFAWKEEVFSCPGCGSSDVEIMQGMELEIDSVEVEEDNAPEN